MDKRSLRSKYDSHVKPNLEKISMWKRDGWTEQDIAKALNVAYSTFMEYKNKYPELVEVLKVENEFIIAKTERTLFQIAWGENPEPVIIEEVEELNRRTGKMEVIKRTVKYDKKPSFAAIVFVLKNRATDKWKDRIILNQLEEAQDNDIAKNIETLTKIVSDGDEDVIS